jgi:hypothetical protein
MMFYSKFWSPVFLNTTSEVGIRPNIFQNTSSRGDFVDRKGLLANISGLVRKEFLRSHQELIAATNFFTAEVWSAFGLII